MNTESFKEMLLYLKDALKNSAGTKFIVRIYSSNSALPQTYCRICGLKIFKELSSDNNIKTVLNQDVRLYEPTLCIRCDKPLDYKLVNFNINNLRAQLEIASSTANLQLKYFIYYKIIAKLFEFAKSDNASSNYYVNKHRNQMYTIGIEIAEVISPDIPWRLV